MRTLRAGERSLWTCDICGTQSEWNRAWEWYGSIAATEGCGHIVATCSDECRASRRALEITTAYDRKHASGFCRSER